MPVSLHISLHSDMMSYMWQFKAELQDLDSRVEHIEQKMGEFASSFNTLVDEHKETVLVTI